MESPRSAPTFVDAGNIYEMPWPMISAIEL